MFETLYKKICNHTLNIGIIGVGYVGLPMAIEMSRKNTVVAFDHDQEKIDKLSVGESYIDNITDEEVAAAVHSERLVPSSEIDSLASMDCYVICVPTPLGRNKEPDISFIMSAARTVSSVITPGNLVILESTVFPGITDELIKSVLESKGLVCNTDFFLAFSPERIDPGNSLYTVSNTVKVVGGVTEEATILASEFYRRNIGIEIHTVSSPMIAEMSKLLENIYRNINIALIDEFAMICYKMGIDVWEVIEAAQTKPFGFQAFYPGPGVGGHCIPLDLYYLLWKLKEFDISATMIETSGRIIDSMKEYVVNRAIDILNDDCKAVNGARILISGIAYKPDISDCRESPAIEIIQMLNFRKAEIQIYDPFVKSITIDAKEYTSIDILREEKDAFDLIVIVTGHRDVSYPKLIEIGARIFDTRNVLKGYNSNKITKL